MKEDLKERTKRFALAVIKLVDSLPRTQVTMVIGRQLIKASSSVGANYRAACRARSRRDFISRISIVEEEADESAYWLEMLFALGLVAEKQFLPVFHEANELTAIFVSSGRTAKSNIGSED